MPNQTWRSGGSGKKPPQQREPQKEAKKSLEDACKEIKKTLAVEKMERESEEKRIQDRKDEDEMMAMVYGPNWKRQMPSWAEDSVVRPVAVAAARKPDPEPIQEDDEEEYPDEEEGHVIPFPRRSDRKRKKVS